MTEFWTLTGAILVSSFLGSWHCSAMCSPIASLMAARKGLGAYHLGRLLSYTAAGVLAGFLGRFFLQNDFTYVRYITAILLSLSLLYAGLRLAFPGQFGGWAHPASQKVARLFMKLNPVSQKRSSFMIGILTAFLPCGWLYTYVTAAAATQSPVAGSLVMALFWLAGLPALSVLPWTLKNLTQTARGWHQKLAGLMLVTASFYAVGSFFFVH